MILVPTQVSGRLWLIGGTQESVDLAKVIAQNQLPCIISVTTESARSLYPAASTLSVYVGRLNFAQIQQFLQQQQIVAVLDASHPYAVEISQNAIAATFEQKTPYLRYERPMLEQGISLDFETLLAGNQLQGQRVLLTIGYRPLHRFQFWHERATLFARILPSVIALEAAFKAGFTPNNIICLRPPISADLEKALWRQWQISLVVTKASGTAGGEDIKRSVAAELGIPLIAINRPIIEYPQQTSNLSIALEFCRHQLALSS